MKIELKPYKGKCSDCQYWTRIDKSTLGSCKHERIVELFLGSLPFKSGADYSCKLFKQGRVK